MSGEIDDPGGGPARATVGLRGALQLDPLRPLLTWDSTVGDAHDPVDALRISMTKTISELASEIAQDDASREIPSVLSAKEMFARLPDADPFDTPGDLPQIAFASPDVDISGPVETSADVRPSRSSLISDEHPVEAAGAAQIMADGVVQGSPSGEVMVAPLVVNPPAIAVGTAGDPYAPSAALQRSADRALAPRRPPVAHPAAPPMAFRPPGAAPKRVRRRRHFGRGLFTVVVMASLLATGVYAAKKYVFDLAEWTVESGQISADVEAQTGLRFARPIAVVDVSEPAFSTQRAVAMLGIPGEGSASLEGEWRAVGILQGTLDNDALAAIGSQPSLQSMAFYDFDRHTVYARLGAPPALRVTSLQHALTVGLMDQLLPELQDQQPSSIRGRRMYAESVADYVVQARAAIEAVATVDARNVELATAVAGYSSSPAPYAAFLAGNGTVIPIPAVADGAAGPDLVVAINSDADWFDAGRIGSERAQVETPAGAKSNGLMYWYHVLAGRVDDQVAWNAATAWAGDASVVSFDSARSGGSPACVDATIAAFDAAGTQVLLDAFQQWAAAAPAESATTVVGGLGSVTIHACDPGTNVPTRTDDQVALVGGASVEHAAVSVPLATEPAYSPAAQRCVVVGVRALGIAADLSTGIGPIVDFCRPAI